MTHRATVTIGPKRPKVLSLFSGAGGLDFGLEAAGFSTAVALDIDADACTTLRGNRHWPVIENCVHEVEPAELLTCAKVRRGEVALLAGGPPCQPFSKSSYWKHGESGRLADPRAQTLAAYLRIVEETLPQAFLLENVHGLAYAKADEGLQLLLDGIERINKRTRARYTPAMKVLDAANYGVPQHRKRFVLIALRDGLEFSFPEATHGPGLRPW